MRLIGVLAAGVAVVAGGVALVVAVVDDGDDEARVQQLSLQAQEVSARQAGIRSGQRDVLYMQTERTPLPPGTLEVTIGECPAGQRVIGNSGPGSIDGNPSTEIGFRYAATDERSIVLTVRNTAETPVPGQFELVCQPKSHRPSTFESGA